MNFFINLKEWTKNFLIKENLYYFLFISGIFSLDRVSKLTIINNYNETPYYINDYINLDLIWNIGIGFGLLSTDSSLYYSLITILIGLVIIFLTYFLVLSETIDKIIYSMIIGGALGNFYDRLIYKAVPDFLDLHYNNFHWFIFNVADIFITIGIFIFIIKSFVVKT